MIQRARRAGVSSPSARCVHSMMERCEDRHRATWSRRADGRSVWTAGLRERFRFGFDNPASRNQKITPARLGFGRQPRLAVCSRIGAPPLCGVGGSSPGAPYDVTANRNAAADPWWHCRFCGRHYRTCCQMNPVAPATTSTTPHQRVCSRLSRNARTRSRSRSATVNAHGFRSMCSAANRRCYNGGTYCFHTRDLLYCVNELDDLFEDLRHR